jgi:polysaccharide export outer membrane protein
MRTRTDFFNAISTIATQTLVRSGLICCGAMLSFVTVVAQSPPAPAAPPETPSPAPVAGSGASAAGPAASSSAPSAATPPADYIIGPDDVLSIFFWRDKDLTGDYVVRPDGKISLPVLNEIDAVGLTPDQLRQKVVIAAKPFFSDDPTVNVIVKQINSRKVYLIGEVVKPGPYPLLETMNVIQLISKAGGFTEYADKKHIRVIRAEKRPDGVNVQVEVNYKDILEGRNLKKNVDLKPGDTVIVK